MAEDVPESPNILLILVDQWRHDHLGLAEHSRCATPALDRISRNGCFFTRAVTPNPVCQPARASLLTGRYPHQINLAVQNGDLRFDVRTMTQALQEAGYYTASVGKLHYWHQTRTTRESLDEYLDIQKRYGFDEIRYFSGVECKGRSWCHYYDIMDRHGLVDEMLAHGKRVDRNGYNNDAPLSERWPGEPWPFPEELENSNVVGSNAVDVLRGQSADTPFYLQVTFSDPHAPYNAPASWLEKVPYEERDDFIQSPDQPLSEADKKALWRNRHHYRASIACIDDWVGKMVAVLEERGMLENTLIAFTSDHGEMLGDHNLYNKQVPYSESSRIPLIVKWPGHSAGVRHDGMVELTDLTATILDAAGLDPRESLDSPGLSFHGRIPGRSLRDIVTGADSTPVRDTAFSVGRGMWSMVETTRWKLVRSVADTVGGVPQEALYDLEADPDELVNLADDAACHDVLIDMRERMLRIYESTPPCQMFAQDDLSAPPAASPVQSIIEPEASACHP